MAAAAGDDDDDDAGGGGIGDADDRHRHLCLRSTCQRSLTRPGSLNENFHGAY